MWRTVHPDSGPGQPLPADPVTGDVGIEEAAPPPAPPRRFHSGALPAPDLVGMTAQDARRHAQLAELRLVVEERPTDRGLRGRVFRQEPGPGAEVEPGEVVTAFVGTRPLVAVPDVSGIDEQEALMVIRAAGLTPSRRVVRRSRSVAMGQVIRTRPRAGAHVPLGTRVAYVVAATPRPKRTPAKRDTRHARGRRHLDGAFLSMPTGE